MSQAGFGRNGTLMQVNPASAFTNSEISVDATLYPSELTSPIVSGNALFMQIVMCYYCKNLFFHTMYLSIYPAH